MLALEGKSLKTPFTSATNVKFSANPPIKPLQHVDTHWVPYSKLSNLVKKTEMISSTPVTYENCCFTYYYRETIMKEKEKKKKKKTKTKGKKKKNKKGEEEEETGDDTGRLIFWVDLLVGFQK
ncbi:hypothetical protein M8J76_003051 [Diaphorina citri]|nr:hypothetical protein M8J76_003051 [Diaphorina citri]